jgi:hypothetical protein
MQNDFDVVNLVVSIVGQLGVWITIILVFLTLKEMEKQRRESYKPVVVIPRFGLRGEAKMHDGIIVFEDFYRGGLHNEEIQWNQGKDSSKEGNFRVLDHVVLYNLGVGAAKDIEIKWELDFEISEAVEKVKEFCYKNSIPLIVEIDKDALKVRKKFRADDNVVYHYSIIPGEHQIDYLLPQSVEPSGIRLRLPLIYEKLLSLLTTTYNYKNPDWPKPELPILLDIHYKDIGNKEYRNQYRLRISHHFFALGEEAESTYFDALFEATHIR